MNLFKPIIVLCAIGALAGCADIRAVTNTIGVVADAQIPANVALVAANSFDAVELSAKNILVFCTPTPAPAICASQRANIRTMSAAVLAGRPIRNAIEPLNAGVASPVSKSAYDKLEAIISTLTSAVNVFNASKGA